MRCANKSTGEVLDFALSLKKSDTPATIIDLKIHRANGKKIWQDKKPENVYQRRTFFFIPYYINITHFWEIEGYHSVVW